MDEKRRAPFAIDEKLFRQMGHRLVDELADLLASVPARPVTKDRPPAAIREALRLNDALPEHGSDPETVLDGLARTLFDHSLFNAHPRFFGYITAAPAPIGVLGDFLASALNPNVGSWTLAPAATEIEAQTVRWIAELIGYPTDCGGLLLSGGNMANIVCFLAARRARAPWDVRTDGVAAPSAPRMVVYCSTETHTWVQKAADLAGLGTSAVRWIPVGPDLAMDVRALSRAIADDQQAGHLPGLVVCTAGSVSTGAVDPIAEIAALCREKGIWCHVDGAYGGMAARVPNAPEALRALALADSVAVDPHKWLYAPLEAGCALVRSRDTLSAAFAYHPPYYHFAEQVLNYVDFGPQNSRGFRALKVWLALRHAGASGYRQMIGDDIALSQLMASAVDRHPELQLVSQALSITTFRYVPLEMRGRLGERSTEEALDALNKSLLDAVQRGGDAFVSNAVVNGRYVLRACIVNFHTERSDVEALPEIVAACGRELQLARARPT